MPLAPDAKTARQPPAVTTAPGPELELQGPDALVLPQATAEFIAHDPKAQVNVRFGRLAAGPVKVDPGPLPKHRPTGKTVEKPIPLAFDEQPIPLSHPLLKKLGELSPGLEPSLFVKANQGVLSGHVGIKGQGRIEAKLKKNAELLGFAGLHFGSAIRIENQIREGNLLLGVTDNNITLGSAFHGTLNLESANGVVTNFEAQVTVHCKGLAESGGVINLNYANDLLTGAADIPLSLGEHLSGQLKAEWDGRSVSGTATVAYQSEKLSGWVILNLMEEGKAKQLERDKKNPPGESSPPPAPPASAPLKDVHYVVFGEGDLAFELSKWLQGNAHGIVDTKGEVTLIGEIRAQSHIPLFDKAYDQPLGPKLEFKAFWGLPVIANVEIGAGGSLSAFAGIKGSLDDVKLEGKYSTDPEEAKNFSFSGALKVTADAGIKLHLYVFVGAEILEHEVRGTGAVDGAAGIAGVVQAKPLIGYREIASDGGKQGEFYLKGSLDVAAQLFLGLSSTVSIDLITPWWSPLHDKTWPWEIASKVWPIGGTFGFGAGVEYIFGSGQPPSLSFGDADVSAHDLLTGIIEDRVADGSSQTKPAEGPWHEKLTPGDTRPPKVQPPGKAAPTKKPPPKPAKLSPKPTAMPAPKAAPAIPSHTHMKDGSTKADHEHAALQQGKSPKKPGPTHTKPVHPHPAHEPAPHAAAMPHPAKQPKGKPKSKTTDTPKAGEPALPEEDLKLGEKLEWKVEGEPKSHHLWIEVGKGHPEIMMASETKSVESQLEEYGKQADASKAHTEIQAARGALKTLEKLVESSTPSGKSGSGARQTKKKTKAEKLTKAKVKAAEKKLIARLEAIEKKLGLSGKYGSEEDPIEMQWPKPRLSSYPHFFLSLRTGAKIPQQMLRNKDINGIKHLVFDLIVRDMNETEKVVENLDSLIANLNNKKQKDEFIKRIKKGNAKIKKSHQGLEDFLSIENPQTLIREYSPTQITTLPDSRQNYGKDLGIAKKHQIDLGTKIKMNHSPGKGTPGGGKLISLLDHFGWNPTKDGKLDGDHILEWQLGGPDQIDNLWPLASELNQKAGPALDGMKFLVPSGKRPLAYISQKPNLSNTGTSYLYLSAIKTKVAQNKPVWFRIVKTNG